jgi:hypothetical protein
VTCPPKLISGFEVELPAPWFARQAYGVEPLDMNEIDEPAEVISERTDFRGVDTSIDAVGFEAKGSMVETVLADLKMEGSSGKASARRSRPRAEGAR